MARIRPMAILRRLGVRIRTRRKALGRTLEEVADAAGISKQQLNMYETGQGHPPVGTWMPVSYTHLDVYKRQLRSFAMGTIHKWMWPCE